MNLTVTVVFTNTLEESCGVRFAGKDMTIYPHTQGVLAAPDGVWMAEIVWPTQGVEFHETLSANVAVSESCTLTVCRRFFDPPDEPIIDPFLYTCSTCGAKFSSQALLADHVASYHPEHVIYPPAPSVTGKPCIIATVLAPNCWLLPYLRLFRDQFVPYRLQSVYYFASCWLLGGLVKGDEI